MALVRAGWSRMRGGWMSLLAAALCPPTGAYAQRAGESAVSAADDAFGTSVGNETLGLYSTNNARGFSPGMAGNVRVEGLYFDQQAALNKRIVRGSTVRVGISAQAYAFPAPTGIADFQLRLPGDKQLVSAVLTWGPYATAIAEVDAQIPIVPGTLSLGVGVSATRNDSDYTVKSHEYEGSVVARWRPRDNAEVSGFYSRSEDCSDQAPLFTFTGGNFESPHPPKRTPFSQPWTRGACTEINAGAFGRIALPDNWTLRGGVFHSGRDAPRAYGEILRGVGTDDIGNLQIFKQPHLMSASTSGEMRAAKVITEGPRRHTFDFALRGRDVARDFGGSETLDVGRMKVGERVLIPEPVFNLGATGDDRARQGTVGVSYEGLWAGIGGVGLGVQKTFYRRTITQPAPTPTIGRSSAQPFLYDAKANLLITKTLAAYAGYTRGFEESGSAPPSSNNRGEAMPVSLTKQVDAGLRYAVTPRFTVVAGAFQVEKPYFNIGPGNIYRQLGTVRHRGIEMSATGQLFTEGLRLVAGVVLIQPRIQGDAVTQGLIGPVEVSVKPRTALLSLQYQPASWRGFGIDGQVNHAGPQFAHQDNLLKIQGNTQLNLGARYSFKVGNVPASLRAQALNVTDVFAWNISPSGAFNLQSRRRFVLTAAADF